MPQLYLGPFLSIRAQSRLQIPEDLRGLVLSAFEPAEGAAQVWVAAHPLPGTQLISPDSASAAYGLSGDLLEEMRFQIVTAWAPVLKHLERQPGVTYSVGAGLVVLG